ncbi:MAG: hypothetical protein WC890_04890 [Candidatus Margulisiibacteriota bacterium]
MSDCPFCKRPAIEEKSPQNDSIYVSCDVCGEYFITNDARREVVNKEYVNDLYLFSGYIKNQNRQGNKPSIATYDLKNILSSWHPITAIEKLNQFLLFLDSQTNEFGQFILFEYDKMYPIVFSKSRDEFSSIVSAASELGYVEIKAKGFKLTISGIKKIEELKETNVNSKYCFIARSFLDKYDAVVINGILPALENTGFLAIDLKTKTHNNLIDNEIVASIKKSRFVIVELSEENQGAYFEAGFAMGLKIPVIRVCHETQKANLHFDASHYSTIFYSNCEELKNRLIQNIEANIL